MACGLVGLLAAGSPHQEADSHCVTIWLFGLGVERTLAMQKLITQWLWSLSTLSGFSAIVHKLSNCKNYLNLASLAANAFYALVHCEMLSLHSFVQ